MSEFPNGLFMPEDRLPTVCSKFMNLCRNTLKHNSYKIQNKKHPSSFVFPQLQDHVVPPTWQEMCAVLPSSFIPTKAILIWWVTTCLYSLFKMPSNFLILFMRSSLNPITKFRKQHQRMIPFGILFR